MPLWSDHTPQCEQQSHEQVNLPLPETIFCMIKIEKRLRFDPFWRIKALATMASPHDG
jgi:hypothetical protein